MNNQPSALRTRLLRIMLLVVGIWISSGCWMLDVGASSALTVHILPRYGDAPLIYDALTNKTAAGQRISVTRLDFLLSDLALHAQDGIWYYQTNFYAFVSGREERTSFVLSSIPAAQYDKIRFHVGLPARINHQDAAAHPAGHTLNPEVNGLHWSWLGGYVFLALEGRWESSPQLGAPPVIADGYSYHIATDSQLMTVEFPVGIELSSDYEIKVALNVDRLFARPNQIRISEEHNSTHSRTNDSLATQLRENVERAFSVVSAGPNLVARGQLSAPNHADIAPSATLYHFTMSAAFPTPHLPADNPLTEEGVELGRRLFFDPLLSLNNSQSCASCHQWGLAFSEHKTVSIGAEGIAGTRNAMPLVNLAWKVSFFWDGRARSLREQVLQPLQNPIEMHETLSNVVTKLRSNQGVYPALFARAFSTPNITADRIARALEQFLLAQTSFNSKFDHVLRGEAQFTTEEQRGFELFHTEYDPRREQFGADCFHCHSGPLFQNQTFANNGLDSQSKDFGRFLVTGKEGDKAKFAVPSLRNVQVTAPYMHDGRFATLEEVVEHYNTGINRNPTLDPNLAKHPATGLGLRTDDKKALVAFLKTLTDQRFVTTTGSSGHPSTLAGAPRKALSSPQ